MRLKFILLLLILTTSLVFSQNSSSSISENNCTKLPYNFMGNWFNIKGSHEWVIGFNEKIVIYKNEFWKYDSVIYKDQLVEVVIVNNWEEDTLSVFVDDQSVLTLKNKEGLEVLCGKTPIFNSEYTKVNFEPYKLHMDTTIIRGFVNNYHKKYNDKDNKISFYNSLTGTEESYPIKVDDYGCYEVKIPIVHPNLLTLYFQGDDLVFYAEPDNTIVFYHEKNGNSSLIKYYMGDNDYINFARQNLYKRSIYGSSTTLPYRKTYLSNGNIYQPFWEKRNDLIINSNFNKRTGLDVAFTSQNDESQQMTYINTQNEIVNIYNKEIPLFEDINYLGYFPFWLKIKRSNNLFNTYYSNNGNNWCEIGESDTLNLSKNAFVGLFISGTNKEIKEALFSNVRINGKPIKNKKWKFLNVGEFQLDSNKKIVDDQIQLKGAIDSFGIQQKYFNYLYCSMKKNTEITANLYSPNSSFFYHSIGLMMYEDNSFGAKYVNAGIGLSGVAKEFHVSKNKNTHRTNLDIYTDLTFKSYNDLVKKRSDAFNGELEQLKKSNSISPLESRLASINKDVYNVYSIINYLNKKQNTLLNDKTQKHNNKDILNIDTLILQEINKVINDDLSLYSDLYHFALDGCISYAIKKTNMSINKNWLYLFQQFDKLSITLTEQEKLKREVILNYYNNQDEKQKSDTSIIQFVDSCSAYFNQHYPTIISWANSNYLASIRISSMNTVFGPVSPLIKDIIKLKSLCSSNANQNLVWSDNLLKKTMVDLSNEQLILPLINQNNKIKEIIEEIKYKYNLKNTSSTLSIYDQYFNSFIEKHKGKVILITFWLVWNHPSIDLIERLESLKEQMKNKDVVFLYITPDDSQIERWEKYRQKFKGEHYRLSKEEYDLLRTRFNKILPHGYVLVDKYGNVVNENVPLNIRDNNLIKLLIEKEL